MVFHWIAVAPNFRCPKRNHLFLAGKTFEISVKTFFLIWRSLVFGWKNPWNFGEDLFIFFGGHLYLAGETSHYFKRFWTLQNRKSVIFELAPGPRKTIWVNYSVFIWQEVNETKKVKNPWSSWSSRNLFVYESVGLKFKFPAGEIRHSVANGSPLLRHFFERSCVARAQWRGDGPGYIVTRFGVLRREQKTWFDRELYT